MKPGQSVVIALKKDGEIYAEREGWIVKTYPSGQFAVLCDGWGEIRFAASGVGYGTENKQFEFQHQLITGGEECIL